MSSHQPFNNDLALYQYYSNPALHHPIPTLTETSVNLLQTSNQGESIMSTHPQPSTQSDTNSNGNGNANVNVSRPGLLPVPQAGRTRTISYNPPSAASTWSDIGRDMIDPLTTLNGGVFVSDFSSAASYPPTTHQRHASYHGGMTSANYQPPLQTLSQPLSQPLPPFQSQSQSSNFDFFAPDFQYQMAPVQAAGTCQPQDIFKKGATEALYAQTTIDTPDTSARATPIDDGRYLSVRNQLDPVPPNDWRASSAATNPLPSIQKLHLRQNSASSMEDGADTSSQTSELDDLALEGLSPAILPRADHDGEKKKRTRTPQACEACRKRKAKCNGGHPCERCKFKHLTCVYAELAPRKPPPVTHARAVSGSRAPAQQVKKRRDSSEHTRYASAPIRSNVIRPPIAQSANSIEKQNILQLQLESGGVQQQRNYWAPQAWSSYTQPTYDLTGSLDDAGLAALGFSSQQPYDRPTEHDSLPSFGPIATYVNGQYVYSHNPITADAGAAGPTSTPSISNDSSPSYGEASLVSPYDFNMIGQASNDSYFPSNTA